MALPLVAELRVFTDRYIVVTALWEKNAIPIRDIA
jgi:hypothetical protein